MKVGVTARGEDMASEVDPRFGRARWFVVVDTESGEFKAIDNSVSADATHGAGPQAAERVSNEGVEVVITGNCGPNAFRTLAAAGIRVVVGAEGTVSDAVAAFKDGKLAQVDEPNVEGHW